MHTGRVSEFNRENCQLVETISDASQALFGRVVSHPKSKILFHQGDEADFVYEVISGVVQNSRVLECGHRQIVSFALPGDTVGLPHRQMHGETCEALTPVVLKVIRVKFDGPGRHNLQLQDWLLDRAADELARLQDHAACLGMMTSTQRIAAFLCMMADRTGKLTAQGIEVALPMLREDIADFLGMRMETVSRSFSYLREKGIIDPSRAADVIIEKPDELRALADYS